MANIKAPIPLKKFQKFENVTASPITTKDETISLPTLIKAHGEIIFENEERCYPLQTRNNYEKKGVNSSLTMSSSNRKNSRSSRIALGSISAFGSPLAQNESKLKAHNELYLKH